jgi:hypothetical protein
VTACRWAGANYPRVIPGRHAATCPETHAMAPQSAEQGEAAPPEGHRDAAGLSEGVTCSGCLPCPEPHCVTCARAHADATCAGCVADTRDDLAAIARLTRNLLTEAEHRGVEGEAAHLHAPTANPEAWRQRRRHGYRDHIVVRPDGTTERPDVIGEDHPLWVTGTWELLVVEHLGHTRRTSRITVASAVSYLDRNLTDLAADPDFPFEDLASEARRCRAHLEAVLHDEERGVRANIPCFECGADLERRLTRAGFDDHWTCRRCRRVYTIAEYNFALRAALEASA